MSTRVLSAIAAIFAIWSIYHFGHTTGLYLGCTIVVIGSMYEYAKLAFRDRAMPVHLRVAFFALCFLIYATSTWMAQFTGASLALAAIVFLSMVVVMVGRRRDLAVAAHLQSAGLVGFVYCGLFPGLATRLLTFENGPQLLFGLMAIVFSGDTFAYLGGRTFGRRKILEAVSPKKTVEGALFGLAGSGFAGAILGHFFFHEWSLPGTIAVSVATGLFAQVGDFYESLLKRVADVKDSGSVMPGHGGILDRIDGIYFGAPIYYVLIQLLSHVSE